MCNGWLRCHHCEHSVTLCFNCDLGADNRSWFEDLSDVDAVTGLGKSVILKGVNQFRALKTNKISNRVFPCPEKS